MNNTIEIVALDEKGCEIYRNEDFETRKQARERAGELIAEREYIESGMVKVGLRVNGECINDWFVKWN